MLRVYSFLFLVCLLSACSEQSGNADSNDNDLTQFVNPLIGTGGHGHTFPGATIPYGMVQLSPDTRIEGWDGCSGYHYSDSVVYGFSHTHLSGTGVSDYCDILLKPCIGESILNNGFDTSPEEGYASYFSKQSETASPGYYNMELEEGIKVELTATARAGFHKYTFEKADNAHVIIDLAHRDLLLDATIEAVDDQTIRGFRRSKSWSEDQFVYFYATFSEPFEQTLVHMDSIHPSPDSIEFRITKTLLSFDLEDRESLLVKVGISSVDLNGAEKNLESELDGWDFEQTRTDAANAWNKALNKIQIEDADTDKKTIFYSALYHTMVAPNLFSDVDGRYRKAIPKKESGLKVDQPIGQLKPREEQYTVFSLWDTYRATHPLYTIIEPERSNAFINTFLRHYQDGGQLPVWELAGYYTGCMIGYHSVSVIADAYAKNIRGFDAELALEAMRHSAEMKHLGLPSLVSKGFIPTGDEPESVSKTLEYAYDDWCIALLAKELGNEAVYNTYIQRAQYYKNLYNAESGFLMGRSNGGWHHPFRPEEVNFNYTEANGWQYSLAVQQDIEGLMALMGGEEAMIGHLDELFSTDSETSGREQVDITGLIGQYAHGNEPSHHMAYLYSFAGQPWKTQAMVHQIMDELYQNAPDGLSGNEDCGQMSAWYVLSAMGFYPVSPGSDEYVIGSPRFAKATIQLENGKAFTITAENLRDKAVYIQSATLNGEAYNKGYIKHSDIANGGELVFTMGTEPNTSWASEKGNHPHSSIDAKPICISPAIVSESRTFEQSLKVELQSAEADAKIFYTLNGDTPSKESKEYSEPLTLKETTTIRAIAENSAGTMSKEVKGEFLKIKGGRSIALTSEYENQYAAEGQNALIDMLRGGKEFRTGNWQGFEGVDLEAVVDLGESIPLNSIRLSCLQDIKSWIWFPRSVEVLISQDGKNFQSIANIENDFSDQEEGSFLKTFDANAKGEKARYIKVKAENYGECPKWHLGAGGTAWLFVDEIIIE